MLGNLRISYKVMMMIGLSVLGIAAMAGLGLSALWGNMMEDRRAKLQDIVTIAHEVLDYDYQLSRKAGLSEAETTERAKASRSRNSPIRLNSSLMTGSSAQASISMTSRQSSGSRPETGR